MSKFDEFIDEFVFMAKNAADVASKKTGEVLEVSKTKYQMKQTEWDIEKSYAKLGALVYESKRSTEDFADAIAQATSEIDDLKAKLDSYEDNLRTQRKIKKCEKCSYDNDTNSLFCSKCGSPLESADPEKEDAESSAAPEAAEDDETAES